MAHVMERAIFNSLLYYGVKVGLYSGDPKKLMDDLSVLKPTIFIAVPIIFNRMFDTINLKISKSNPVLKALI